MIISRLLPCKPLTCLDNSFLNWGQSKMISVLFVVTLAVVPFSTSLQAQEKGRLADGRAFRTDSSGSQIVDYTAELELEIDGLRRTVTSLEDEIQALRRSGGRDAAPVQERDLVASGRTTTASNSCPQTDQSALRSLRSELRTCEDELKSQNSSSSRVAAVTQENRDLRSRMKGIETELAQLRTLRSEYADLKDSHRKLVEEFEKGRAEIVRLRGELKQNHDGVKASLASASTSGSDGLSSPTASTPLVQRAESALREVKNKLVNLKRSYEAQVTSQDPRKRFSSDYIREYMAIRKQFERNPTPDSLSSVLRKVEILDAKLEQQRRVLQSL